MKYLKKEDILKSLNESKMSVAKATEAYRQVGLVLQHFRKEQKAILDEFKASEGDAKESIKPILIYYHNLIKDLEAQVASAEADYEMALGMEKDDELELNEGKGSEGSDGEFSTPSLWVATDGKWKPKMSKMKHAQKPLYKGGKFVKVKKSCETYPYCDQGDINSLELTNKAKDIAESIHKETGIDKNVIKSVILEHMTGF
tara:strand:- start:392 stop:994 length:603 start_codon:yes stop_codon:yes gene_type:complete